MCSSIVPRAFEPLQWVSQRIVSPTTMLFTNSLLSPVLNCRPPERVLKLMLFSTRVAAVNQSR